MRIPVRKEDFFFLVNTLIRFGVEPETLKDPEYGKNCSIPGKRRFSSVARRESRGRTVRRQWDTMWLLVTSLIISLIIEILSAR